MSTHVARTRVILARSRTSRSYSSTAASTNTNYTQQSKATTRTARGPIIPRKPRIQDLSNDMPPRSFLLDLPAKPKSKRLTPSQRNPEPLSSFEKKIANNPYGMPLLYAMFWEAIMARANQEPFFHCRSCPLTSHLPLLPMSNLAAILATPVRQCLYTRLLLPSGTVSESRISDFLVTCG